jgi:glucose-1-phosphate thymidylyltransferase
MKLIIPMAGKGTRLRPHTILKSKALFEIGGKPILGHILNSISKLRIKEAIFIVDEPNLELERFLKQNHKFKCSFVIQKERKGVGHAIYETKKLFNLDSEVFVLFADTLIEADVSNIKKGFHDGIIWTQKVQDPTKYGVVYLNDGIVTRLIEKPEFPDSDLAIVGMYYFKSSKVLFKSLKYIIDNDIKSKGEYQLTDAMQYMINSGSKLISRPVNIWQDCGNFESILEANKYLLNKIDIKGPAPKTSVIIKPVFIGVGSKVTNSVIGPNVSIGNDCIIDGAIIKNSVIGEEVSIQGGNMDKCLVGSNVNLKIKGKSLNLGDYSSADF